MFENDRPREADVQMRGRLQVESVFIIVAVVFLDSGLQLRDNAVRIGNYGDG